MLSVTNKPYMLNVVMLSVVMLSALVMLKGDLVLASVSLPNLDPKP